MSKKKRTSKNEFRYNYDLGHTQYVFEKENDNFHSVGLTTKKITFGKKNMPLSYNAKKGESQQSYVRNGINNKNFKSYSGIDKRFSFQKDDFANVKAKIRNYKNNRRKKKNKNKHFSTE